MKKHTNLQTPQSLTTDSATNPTTKYIKRLKIIVTQKEIDTAKQGKADGCMIQKALKRDYPTFQNIWVDKQTIRFSDPEKNVIYTFEMHPRGRVMLLKWDSGEEIKPFELWVRKPVVRERQLIGGAMRPKPSQQRATQHHGPVRSPKTKEQRAATGKDRLFGRKLWADELAQVRADLGM